MKLIIKIIGIVFMLGALLVMGMCYWQNCREDTGPAQPDAKYKVIEKVTGNVYFTDKQPTVTGFGDAEIYTLYGYWEVTKSKYKYHDVALPLDERYFGEIEVTLR